MQTIRRRLKESGIDVGWNAIRRIMAGQCRITASFRRADGRALHIRKATRAEPGQLAIYHALPYTSTPPPPEVYARLSYNPLTIDAIFQDVVPLGFF